MFGFISRKLTLDFNVNEQGLHYGQLSFQPNRSVLASRITVAPMRLIARKHNFPPASPRMMQMQLQRTLTIAQGTNPEKRPATKQAKHLSQIKIAAWLREGWLIIFGSLIRKRKRILYGVQ